MAAALTTGRTVVTLTGDGDFVMSMGELATAAQYGVKTIMLVLNNGMYGSIRMHQERHFPGRVSGSDLHNPDFAALAETFGLAGARVRCTADFEPALLAALNRDCSTVIEIALDPQAITTRSSLDEIRARAHAALAAPATVGH
jgi:acetolactate synthase-1/2/3 large subunit